MKPSESLKIHRKAVQKIINDAQKDGITDFRVFGSVARGTDREGSDLDILVKAPKKKYLLKILGLIVEFEELLKVHVDLMAESQLPQYMKYVIDESIPL